MTMFIDYFTGTYRYMCNIVQCTGYTGISVYIYIKVCVENLGKIEGG